MINLIAYLVLGVGGMWIVSDGLLSWTLYANAQSYENGRKQTFKKDHWVRLVRIVIGVTMIISGWVLLNAN